MDLDALFGLRRPTVMSQESVCASGLVEKETSSLEGGGASSTASDENGEESQEESLPQNPLWCLRCGREGHSRNDCILPPSVTCFKCDQQGHLSYVCHSRRGKRRKVADNKKKECDSSLEKALTIYSNIAGDSRLLQDLLVNSTPIEFEVDTGVAMSIVSRSTWRRIGEPALKKTSVKLKGLSGHALAVRGECQVEVAWRGVRYSLTLLVVKKARRSLCGRDWMARLGMTLSCQKVPSKEGAQSHQIQKRMGLRKRAQLRVQPLEKKQEERGVVAQAQREEQEYPGPEERVPDERRSEVKGKSKKEEYPGPWKRVPDKRKSEVRGKEEEEDAAAGPQKGLLPGRAAGKKEDAWNLEDAGWDHRGRVPLIHWKRQLKRSPAYPLWEGAHILAQRIIQTPILPLPL